MADRTAIEWTEATWTPIRAMYPTPDGPKIGWHCEHASPGCVNCYAEGINKRLGTGFAFKPGHLRHTNKHGEPRGDVAIFLDEKMLLQPLRWKRPRMIFVCSMTDLFADFVTDEMIDRVFAVMALCAQHTFQVLTKRSARMRAYLSDPRTPGRIARLLVDKVLIEKAWPLDEDCWPVKSIGDIDDPADITITLPLPNVWAGVSAEDQQRADERVAQLLATPAAVRWVSLEPLLGPVDISFAFSRSVPGHRRDWSTFSWPQWVPSKVREQVEGFWCTEWGRGPTEWMRGAIENGQPPLGTPGQYRLCQGGEPHAAGRFVPAWNNIGRVIDADGKAHVASAGGYQSRPPRLNWVVAGGESGPHARPVHPQWARDIRDQCAAAGVAFLFKQWGEFSAHDIRTMGTPEPPIALSGSLDWRRWSGVEFRSAAKDESAASFLAPGVIVARVGKRAAGRLLDGVQHDGYPGIAA